MMKKTLLTASLVACAAAAFAQGYPGTPPAVSPMPMKPEMTEIWEPEVATVTPAKNLGEAPSDAIILFNGKDLSLSLIHI